VEKELLEATDDTRLEVVARGVATIVNILLRVINALP